MSTKPKKKSIPKVVKDLSWNKWIGEDVARTKCMCCGVNEIKMSSFHCGHVIAEANGGKMSIDNLKPICSACNLSMGTENMDDFKGRCGFIAEAKPVSKEKKKEAVMTQVQMLLINGKLEKCPGQGFPLSLSEINGAPCPGGRPFSRHCKACGCHYNSFINDRCPCLSKLLSNYFRSMLI